MNRELEVSLLQECLELSEQQSPRLAERESESPVQRYTDEDRFAREMEDIFKVYPIPLAHSSELEGENSFVVRDSPWGSLIVTRGSKGVNAFHNVCRHRGARLLHTEQGCAERFQCPYHAWTYNSDGDLVAVPHGRASFPELERESRGLSALHCEERFGLIWISALPSQSHGDFFDEGFSADLNWLELDKLHVFQRERKTWRANWKLIAEGGLETYHFRFAHSDTIAPYFLDNVAVADFFGLHTRTVLPFASLPELKEQPREEWSLRESSHILYSVFPMSSLLVERDHVVWIQSRPFAADATEITLTTLVPDNPADLPDRARDYWQRNHDITVTVLDEDFLLGQQIQAGFASGANTTLRFGRNEGSLQLFNEKVERVIEGN